MCNFVNDERLPDGGGHGGDGEGGGGDDSGVVDI